jgi:hypothetical protein
MNRKNHLYLFLCFTGLCLAATAAYAQDPQAPPDDSMPHQQGQGRMHEGQNGERPLIGKITAMHEGSLDLTGPDGQVTNVKVNAQTEYRKDRQPAKANDFKVGDLVMVRGDQNPDHSVTARMIGARTGGPGGGPGGGNGMFLGAGTLGKDYVAGEVKSVDPPRLTVLRADNVTQTLELNEDSTLHRGRESITMADIQVGDHVMARGAVQNDVFVPKGVMVMNPDQWKRMQDFLSQNSSGKPANSEAPAPKQ